MATRISKTMLDYVQAVSDWLTNKAKNQTGAAVECPILDISGTQHKLWFMTKGVRYFAVVSTGQIQEYDFDKNSWATKPGFMLIDGNNKQGAMLSALIPYLHHKKDCPYDPALCGSQYSPSDCKLREILINTGLVVPASAKSA